MYSCVYMCVKEHKHATRNVIWKSFSDIITDVIVVRASERFGAGAKHKTPKQKHDQKV